MGLNKILSLFVTVSLSFYLGFFNSLTQRFHEETDCNTRNNRRHPGIRENESSDAIPPEINHIIEQRVQKGKIISSSDSLFVIIWKCKGDIAVPIPFIVFHSFCLNYAKTHTLLVHCKPAIELAILSTPLQFSANSPAIVHQMAKTSKEAFFDLYDYGVPINKNDGMEDVLIFYTTDADDTSHKENHKQANDWSISFIPDPVSAAQNCDLLKVVATKGGANTCLALVGVHGSGSESFHIHQWMRPRIENPKTGKKEINRDLPHSHASRGQNINNSVNQFVPPSLKQMERHQNLLQSYMNSIEHKLETLKEITQRVANERNEIIVLTSNLGQSSLLMNFVCHSKAHGFDISNVLLFPTDRETLELGQGLGLATFFDEEVFSNFPHGEAKRYGDRTFVAMMLAKVLSVQLVNFLGYNVLFQDVDIVWYKHPLSTEVFSSPSLKNFDMIFQEDGAHSTRYAPYSANSGFYYVRSNPRTRYLLIQLLLNGGANIIQSGSHQQVLISLLTEHASLYGLRVKVLQGDDFPGGWHFHRRKELMKSIMEKKFIPYIFHMSWTLNESYKLQFLKQMGLWYLKDSCEHQEYSSLMDGQQGKEGELIPLCCAAEAQIKCFYRDKPSIIPCKDSPQLDVAGYTFAKSVDFW